MCENATPGTISPVYLVPGSVRCNSALCLLNYVLLDVKNKRLYFNIFYLLQQNKMQLLTLVLMDIMTSPDDRL